MKTYCILYSMTKIKTTFDFNMWANSRDAILNIDLFKNKIYEDENIEVYKCGSPNPFLVLSNTKYKKLPKEFYQFLQVYICT